MKKENTRVFGIFLLGIWVSVCCIFFYLAYIRKEQRLQKEAYYFSICVSKFSEAGIPYIPVEIENQMVLAKLDLGFQGCFAFSDYVLDKIQNKKFLYLKKYYGIHGLSEPNKVYEISKSKIGSFSFVRSIIYEAPGSFFDTRLVLLKGDTQYRENRAEGIVGWHPFSLTNVFLDLGNSLVGFAGSLEALKQNGYAEKKFIKTPLLTDRGLIEIEVEGPDGLLRCALDTGCSCSMKYADCKEGQTLERLILENVSNDTSLLIGGERFGPILFIPFPIRTPIKIEAILGMEFLKKHVVFLDFAEKYVYFSIEPVSQRRDIIQKDMKEEDVLQILNEKLKKQKTVPKVLNRSSCEISSR